MLNKYFSLNGKIIPNSQAVLPINNIEFSYGFAVYENLKVRNKKLYFAKEHIIRLFKSAQIIKLEHNFQKEQIKKWIKELLEKNKIEDSNIKMILIGAEKSEDTQLFIFSLAPRFVEKKEYRDGVKVITYKYERFLPQAKTLNMLPSYLAYREAKMNNAYDALFIDKTGNVAEGTRCNFFTIKNKTLFTPPLKNVLAGVTRNTVIKCAKQNSYKIVEKNIKLKEIFKYDGAFLTSTSSKILPIRTIDKKSFGTIALELKELIMCYDKFLKN